MAKRKIKDISTHEEGPETKKIKLDEVTLEPHPQCSFSALPLEIISEYIFKYFDFQKCLELLVLVCKQWHLAAQVSTMHKQLVVHILDNMDSIGSVLSTYGVNTLILNPTNKEATLRDLAQMLNAVPKLTTLVCKAGSAISHEIEGARYSKAPQDNESTFEHIKTLSVAQLKTMQLLTKFPNLTQLKIESLWTAYSTYRPPAKVVYPTVTELELNAQHGSALESITDSFPGLKTLFVNDMGGTVALRFLDAITENHGVKVILNRDPHNLTALSYVDYFNACGRTPLQYFIEKKDNNKVKEVLTKYTNETYERDLLMRQPQFKFPTRHTYFQSHTSEVKKSSLSNEMIFTLVENGGLGYWSALYLISDVGTVKKTLMLANQHRPVPSEALKAMAKLNCHLSVPVNQIADLVGEDTFKEIATVRDNQGNTLLHLLARKSANLPVYWDHVIPYSDIHALNNKQENAATIAFHARHWMCWQMLVEQGTAIQQEKYIQDLASTRHLLTWILNTATSFRIMKYFKESSSYLQTMFFELQHLTSPRKHFLFRKLIKLGVDPKQYNHHGQSLLNTLVEQTANTLIEEWDCIAECDLNLDERDSSGRTPLITAIKLGLLKKAKFLLEKGANPNIHGITARGNKIYPVQLAQTVTDDNVINLLAAHGADFTIEDKDGNTIINAAITKHKFVDVKALAALVSINKPNKHNMTPLAQSICIADLTKVEACLASGADVNQLAGPLLQSPLLLALEADEQAIVRCLLATGRVDVTLKDKAGRSFINYLLRTEPLWEISPEILAIIPIHYATPKNISFVKTEVEAILKTPETSHFATKILKFATNDITFTKFFIEVLGINANIEDSNGDTMLSLIEFHARKSPLVIDFLVSRGANVNHQNKQKNTPLMKAMDIIARDKDDEHVRVLLRNGASVELKNIWGLAPIDIEPTIMNKK